jgi:hypothetical protein
MGKTKKKKTFDAVDAVREIRDIHYERTKGTTPDERLSFYRQEGRWAQDEMERFARQASKLPI